MFGQPTDISCVSIERTIVQIKNQQLLSFSKGMHEVYVVPYRLGSLFDFARIA